MTEHTRTSGTRLVVSKEEIQKDVEERERELKNIEGCDYPYIVGKSVKTHNSVENLITPRDRSEDGYFQTLCHLFFDEESLVSHALAKTDSQVLIHYSQTIDDEAATGVYMLERKKTQQRYTIEKEVLKDINMLIYGRHFRDVSPNTPAGIAKQIARIVLVRPIQKG